MLPPSKQSEAATVDAMVQEAHGLTTDESLLAPIRALGVAYRQQMQIEAPLNPRTFAESRDLSQEFAAVAAGRAAIVEKLDMTVRSLKLRIHHGSFDLPAATVQSETALPSAEIPSDAAVDPASIEAVELAE